MTFEAHGIDYATSPAAAVRSSGLQGSADFFTATVIVSHRFSAVADAGLILAMDAGQLVEAGSHDELAAGGHHAELYGIQPAAYAT